MKKTHAIIYIPGLGDAKLQGQGFIMNVWRAYGVNTIVHPMRWAEDAPFEPKFKALLQLIDDLHSEGKTVSLIGVSAGASAALNAFASRSDVLHRVVCICGKINNLKAINESYFIKNPTFKGSVDRLEKSLSQLGTDDRSRIQSIHPLFDDVVPIKDTKIKGAYEKTIPSVGHLVSIGYALTIGSFGIIKFIKKSRSA